MKNRVGQFCFSEVIIGPIIVEWLPICLLPLGCVTVDSEENKMRWNVLAEGLIKNTGWGGGSCLTK